MYEYKAVVERVVDADTVRLRVDLGYDTWHVGSFRLLGIAARELGQPGGHEARQRLEILTLGHVVTIRSVKADKYGGRYLAHVTLPDGAVDVAAVLVAEGWAVPWDGRGAQPSPPWPREVIA